MSVYPDFHFFFFKIGIKKAIGSLFFNTSITSIKLMSGILLFVKVTEAILNSERLGSGLTEDGLPMGISYSSHGFTKSAITNASFKAKKLPGNLFLFLLLKANCKENYFLMNAFNSLIPIL